MLGLVKRRLISAILMGVGVLAAVVFGLIAVVAAASALRPATEAQTPSEFKVYLATGKWELFELTGSIHSTSLGFFSYTAEERNAPDIDPSLITVLDPGGRTSPLGDSYGNGTLQTYTRGQGIYTGVVSFTAPAAGYYTFSIRSPGPDEVLISRPVLNAITSPLPWFIVAVAGAIVFTVGLVLFIVDLDRRRKAAVAAATPPYPPDPPYPPAGPSAGPPG